VCPFVAIYTSFKKSGPKQKVYYHWPQPLVWNIFILRGILTPGYENIPMPKDKTAWSPGEDKHLQKLGFCMMCVQGL
jgi:hypothetical protein